MGINDVLQNTILYHFKYLILSFYSDIAQNKIRTKINNNIKFIDDHRNLFI